MACGGGLALMHAPGAIWYYQSGPSTIDGLRNDSTPCDNGSAQWQEVDVVPGRPRLELCRAFTLATGGPACGDAERPVIKSEMPGEETMANPSLSFNASPVARQSSGKALSPF